MTRAAIGIDPGKDGGIAVLVLDDGGIRCVYQALTHRVAPHLEPSLMHDALGDAVHELARLMVRDRTVVLERVGAMPKQGLSSTFAFGHGRGVWRGLIAARLLDTVLEPTPAKWSRDVLANIPGDGKERALNRASQVAGVQLIPPGCRVPQDGIADAVCLALFGLRANS